MNKISAFLTLIDKRKPKIIALTEIIAKNKQDFHLVEYGLPEYDLFVNKDPKRGVAIYTIKHLNAKEVMMDESIFNESVFCSFNFDFNFPKIKWKGGWMVRGYEQ